MHVRALGLLQRGTLKTRHTPILLNIAHARGVGVDTVVFQKANGEEQQRGMDCTGQMAALEHFHECVRHLCRNVGEIDP